MNTKVAKSKTVFTIIVLLSISMLILLPSEDVIAKTDAKVEVIKTIPMNDNGSYQHFVKICADQNNRLERPNVIVSSDTETYREQLYVNLPPTFCTYQDFFIDAQNPDSIIVRVVDSRNF